MQLLVEFRQVSQDKNNSVKEAFIKNSKEFESFASCVYSSKLYIKIFAAISLTKIEHEQSKDYVMSYEHFFGFLQNTITMHAFIIEVNKLSNAGHFLKQILNKYFSEPETEKLLTSSLFTQRHGKLRDILDEKEGEFGHIKTLRDKQTAHFTLQNINSQNIYLLTLYNILVDIEGSVGYIRYYLLNSEHMKLGTSSFTLNESKMSEHELLSCISKDTDPFIVELLAIRRLLNTQTQP